MNRERLLTDAKARALDLAQTNYAPPMPRTSIPAPGRDVQDSLRLEDRSDHDVTVAARVAHVLCGGFVAAGTLVSEQYLLDLEREAFLSLCGEKNTQERIAYTLKTGKPLRN